MKKIALLIALALGACESITENPQEQQFGASMSSANMKPPVTSPSLGSGSVVATLWTLGDSAMFEYQITYAGLDGAANAAHFHGPANTENPADILVSLNELPAGSSGTISLGARAGSGSGAINLRNAITATVSGDSLHALLHAGLVYVDVHSSTNPNGEIRGQLVKQ